MATITTVQFLIIVWSYLCNFVTMRDSQGRYGNPRNLASIQRLWLPDLLILRMKMAP